MEDVGKETFEIGELVWFDGGGLERPGISVWLGRVKRDLYYCLIHGKISGGWYHYRFRPLKKDE